MEMERWRDFFERCGEDLWSVIDWALVIAAMDHPQELRKRRDGFAEKLFAQPQFPIVSSNCEGPVRSEVRNVSLKTEEAMNMNNMERCRVEDDEAAPTTTTCSYGDGEEDRDEETLMRREIFSIRHRLEECGEASAEDEFIGPLQRLEQMNISVKLLKDTEIGKVVNGLRKHNSKRVRAATKRLIRIWKHVVDEWAKTATEVATAEIKGNIQDEEAARRPISGTCPDASLVKDDLGRGEEICNDYRMKPEHLNDVPLNQRSNTKLNGYRKEILPVVNSVNEQTKWQSSSRHMPEPRTSTNLARVPAAPKRFPDAKRVPPAAKPAGPCSPECGSVTDKIEAVKRRMHEGYQEAASAKKQRMVQVMGLEEIPLESHNKLKIAGNCRRMGQR